MLEGERGGEAKADYHDLGITKFLIRGFDPLLDAVQYGRELLPRARQVIADRRGAVAAE